MKKAHLAVVGVLLLAVVLGWVYFASSLGNHQSGMMSTADTQKYMQSMMGVKTSDQLPLKTAADQKPLTPTVKDGVKEFTLAAKPIRWQYASGKTITAWAYNGQIPGPEIRVIEGDKVKITLTNKLPKETTIHWHGLNVPNSMDGVPGVTQDAIKSGASFSYEFTATPAGTHFYHTHGSGHEDEAQQMDMGLSGAFIIEPKNYQKPDKEYTLVLDDWQKSGSDFNMSMQDMGMDHAMSMNYNLFTMNGLAFPDTKALEVKKGDKVRIRLINASSSTTHPMHLHGHQFKVVAEDGNEVPPAQQRTRNTIALNPGETYDIEIAADNPGIWAFHCHELHHAGSGMVTLFKYDGYSANSPAGDQDDMQMEDGMMDHSTHH
ncbi:MAG TPA: multicopper oxidase domain-containing protein [Candidatus Saccharimonadales bacterium]|nr:multicopper oxidase domain-containing protein [Candidatus Saccharimonadales bacterium]